MTTILAKIPEPRFKVPPSATREEIRRMLVEMIVRNEAQRRAQAR